MSPENPLANLNDEQLRILHATAESFESDLRTGKPARIESFLQLVPEEILTNVFGELFAIELEFRRAHSSTPEPADYLNRFPDFQEQVHQLMKAEQDHPSVADVDRQAPGLRGFRRSKSAESLLAAGTVIGGRYRVLELIGEGGMGSVYLADQYEPVTRQVAIKFIKGGMDSTAVQARFDIERQSLAMMDHPGIARVYDGGQTETGLPYFVMELVRGVPITRYCDEQSLDVRSRLQLFVSVCRAVQHAHSKGIIHRDLKPGNILVTVADGLPRPKVIDFGVAKAIDQRSSEHRLAATAMIVGTPAYMSPEQADPGSMDIDTRTDVYALGIVLYELLVGSPPHDADSVPRGAVLELLRLIREVDSPRPSTKAISSVSLSKIAANRSIEPQKLAPMLRGELDWIALKAIDKDRARRYETVSGLGQDVERYLAGEVVEARPPSRTYRLQKLVKRHKVQVIAAGLLLVTMTAGIAGTTWGLLAAKKQEKAAQNELLAREEARKNEAAERKHAEAIADFVIKDFLALTSLEGRLDFDDGGKSGLNKDSTLRDLLDRAAEKLKTRTDLEPQTKARLLNIVGQSYINLGAYPEAIESFQQSSALFADVFGKDHADTLAEQGLVVYALYQNGQYDLAIPLAEEVLEKKIALLGQDHADVLHSKRMLAKLLRKTGDPTKAVDLLQETLAGLTSMHGPHEHIVLSNMYDLALAMNDLDQPGKAVPLLEETLALQVEHLGENHPDVHATRKKLAELYAKSGQYEKAQPLIEVGVAWAKENYGPEHPSTIYAMAGLAGFYRSQRQLEKLVPLSEQLLDVTRKAFGDEHPNVANAAADLAMTYRVAGDHEKALPLFQEALALRTTIFGTSHPLILSSKANVAAGLSALGKTEESQLMNEECLKLALEILGEDHSTTITIKQNLAVGYWKAKQLDRSVPLFEGVLDYWVAKSGRGHPTTLSNIANLGVNYRDAGRLEEALPLLEEVYRAVPDVPSVKFIGIELLDCRLQAGKIEEALELLPVLVDDARKSNPADSTKLAKPLATMGAILLRSDRMIEAEPLLRESVNIRQKLAPDDWGTFDITGMLGESLLKQEQYDAAEPFLVAAIEGMQLHLADGPKNAAGRCDTLIDQLVESLKSQNRPEDASKWLAKRSRTIDESSE